MQTAQAPRRYEDKVRKTLKCQKCLRTLAKIDQDGTLHYKPPKGPELIVTGENFRLILRCEQISFFRANAEGMREPIRCGNKTLYSYDRSRV